MKKISVMFLLILVFQKTYSQNNLVINGSFEDTLFCPDDENQIERALGWINFGQTPDYFNSCSIDYSVPNNARGMQFAHSGNAYAGIIMYWPLDYREYIATQFSQSLIIGQKYFVSFYVSLEELFGDRIACNKIGVKLSTIPYSSTNNQLTNNHSQFYTDSIINDTLNWIFIHGSFIADSAYEYLIIGNFFDNFNTDTISNSQFSTAAAYYIDDVCLTTDSIPCSFSSDILNLPNNNLPKIYFNSSITSIVIQDLPQIESSTKSSLMLFDLAGRTIVPTIDISEYDYIFPIKPIANGIYIVKIISGKFNYQKKIFINTV